MTKRAWLALCTIVGVSTVFAGCGSDEATGDGDEKGGKSGMGDAGETGTLLGGSSNGGSGAVTGGRAPTGGVGGTAAGSPNTGGKAATGGAGGTPASVSVGQECINATSCGDLECLTAEDSGIPQGLCTAGCLVDADCPGATDVCLVFDTEDGAAGICLEGCTMGSPPALSAKCHNRPEMACSMLYLVTGDACTADADCPGADELCDADGQCRKPTTACYPQCASDNDCPDAMFCDPESGACVDEEVTGDVDGTPCDGEAAEDSCLGRCATFVDEDDVDIESICVSECTFAAPSQCGWEDDTEPAPAVCFPRFDGGGEGDQGLCYPLCDCDSDCLGEHKCYEYTEDPQEFLTLFGRRGICFYPDDTPTLETCE